MNRFHLSFDLCLMPGINAFRRRQGTILPASHRLTFGGTSI